MSHALERPDEGGRCPIRPIRAVSPLFAVLAIAVPTHAQHHRRGCNTARCDRRIDRVWTRLHRPPFAFGSFELCVANRENGEPGATSFGTVNWRADNGYEGAFSWEPAKWAAGGGLRYAAHAYEATPEQQVRVFRQNGRNGEWTVSNWPTIPPCRGA